MLITACPPELPPGTDCWETQAGTQQRIKVPGNYLGPASDPVDAVVSLEGNPGRAGWASFVSAAYPGGCGCPTAVEYDMVWVDRHGDPTDPTSQHAVKQVANPAAATTDVDTCVYRSVRTDWEGENTAVEVTIQLVGLSLKSSSPLEVTYHETTDPMPSTTRYFQLYVTESASQQVGTMRFTPETLESSLAEGAAELEALPVRWDVEFVEVDAGGTVVPGGIVKSLTDQPLRFAGTLGDFRLTED
jgi:hypothetical protein